MKRGDRVRAVVTGTLVRSPTAGAAQIRVDGTLDFWAVVPDNLIEIEEEVNSSDGAPAHEDPHLD